MKLDFLADNGNTLLRIDVKAIIDTVGENKLAPSRLVVGVVPKLPIIFTDLPKQKERTKAIAKPQMEKKAIVVERRVATALSKNLF